MTAKVGWNPSFIWRSLLWGRELLKEGLRWRVANGKKVLVYRDKWVPNQPLQKILSFPQLPSDTKVSSLLN